MKLKYDATTDSLYIHLSDTLATNSEEVSDGVVLDFANGVLVGIDVQHASKRAGIHSQALSHLPVQTLTAA